VVGKVKSDQNSSSPEKKSFPPSAFIANAFSFYALSILFPPPIFILLGIPSFGFCGYMLMGLLPVGLLGPVVLLSLTRIKSSSSSSLLFLTLLFAFPELKKLSKLSWPLPAPLFLLFLSLIV